jgi:hypothetical protein
MSFKMQSNKKIVACYLITPFHVTMECLIAYLTSNLCMPHVIVYNGETIVKFKSMSIGLSCETFLNSTNDIAMSPPSIKCGY